MGNHSILRSHLTTPACGAADAATEGPGGGSNKVTPVTQSTPRLPQQIVAWRSPRDPAGAERGKTADWPRLRERVAALYRQIPIQVLAGLLSLVILLVQLSGRMATMPLLGWAGLVLLCLAFRWGVGRVERRAALKLGMREWERLWFMAALPGAVALAAAIGHS